MCIKGIKYKIKGHDGWKELEDIKDYAMLSGRDKVRGNCYFFTDGTEAHQDDILEWSM